MYFFFSSYFPIFCFKVRAISMASASLFSLWVCFSTRESNQALPGARQSLYHLVTSLALGCWGILCLPKARREGWPAFLSTVIPPDCCIICCHPNQMFWKQPAPAASIFLPTLSIHLERRHYSAPQGDQGNEGRGRVKALCTCVWQPGR